MVLSQYLARINEAGEIPPQEEGLFSNSWNGKFHLEVQPLHLAHFAAWGRPELLERNLGWYLGALPSAQATARRHGVEGAWWTKMAGPEGRNSPSTINPFIMWQQPAPIYLAEMVWRARRDRATLDRYAELVEETAKLLASWPRRDASGALVLGPPIIPVQENHPPLTTVNPAFEAEFFRYGLGVAQQWRERRGLPRNAEWDAVIADLAPPAIADGLVLPVASEPDFWRQTMACSGDATQPGCLNRDHPSMLMAYGLIAGRVDPEAMRRTLRAVEQHWDLRQTWGWDFPVIAMTAARLGEREARGRLAVPRPAEQPMGRQRHDPARPSGNRDPARRPRRGECFGRSRRPGVPPRRRDLLPVERLAAPRRGDDGRGLGRFARRRARISRARLGGANRRPQPGPLSPIRTWR